MSREKFRQSLQSWLAYAKFGNSYQLRKNLSEKLKVELQVTGDRLQGTGYRGQGIDKFMKISSYKELIVWQKSMDLVEEVYKITKELPKSEIYGLSSQSQRAAVAIPSNIAEGSKRNHKPEYVQFLSIANGSAAELETQLNLIKKIYPNINIQKAENLLEEVLKMLYVLLQKLKTYNL